jgi:hypothetical protein
MKVFLSFFLSVLGLFSIVEAQPIRTCTELSVASIENTTLPNHLPHAVSRAVSYKPKYGLYWANGATIKVKFIGGSEYVRNKVKHYAKMWTKYANLDFKFVQYGSADLRVSFTQNGSSWSVIGKQALRVENPEPTMNFGWLNDGTPEYEFRRTILHEFGHALGLLHEHQNPSGGIPWDEAAVYSHYWQTQGWDEQTTYQNVIKKASRNVTQYSEYDPHSIMHYPVSSRLTDGKYKVGMNQHLSSTDIAYVRRLYPGRVWISETNDNNAETEKESRPDWVEKPKPATKRFIVGIQNSLGRQQIAETVDLYLGGKKFTFKLDKNGLTTKTFRFRMRAGNYDYQLSSASVYVLTQKKWNGWKYVKEKVKKTIYGSGSGTLRITGEDTLSLYGNYDRETDRMKIYIK